MKENTFLNNVKTKASTLGMTALLTLNSVSLAFAEQTGGKGTVNPANEANNSINNFSDMLRLLFPGIAILSGLGACILMMGDKKRTVALDRLMWIAIALCAGSALVSFVDYLWQPK